MRPPVVRRLGDAARTLGPGRALLVAARSTWQRRFVVIQADLGKPLPPSVPPPGAACTPLAEATRPRLARLDPAMTPSEVRRRLEEGQQCRLGWLDGVLAYYRWESDRPAWLPYLGRWIRPGPGDYVVLDVFTHAAFRRRGLAGWMSATSLQAARAAGYRRALWLTAWWNVPGLRIGREASQVCGTVGYRGLGPWRAYFASGRVTLTPDGTIVVGSPAAAGPRLPA